MTQQSHFWAEVRNPSKAITLMKQNLELRPGEQLHPWNRLHLSMSGASQDETTSPPPGQHVCLRGWADHSLPVRGLPRKLSQPNWLENKEITRREWEQSCSPLSLCISLMKWAKRVLTLLLWPEWSLFLHFFFFFAIKTKKRCGNWIWKMTSMLLYQRLCGNQNFLSLQSKSVLTIFNFWT